MTAKRFKSVAVLGAGAWGTALAQTAARAGMDVRLWGRDAARMMEIATSRENSKYLPKVRLESDILVTNSLEDCADCNLILLVAPAQSLRAVCAAASHVIADAATLVVCAKGIEMQTRLFVSEIVSGILPSNPVCVLSGPSFASDVASGLPTAVTVAGHDASMAEEVCDCLGSHTFRLYHSSDVRGVEIGGSAKNVLAIACGVAEGRQLGASARAALIARGFAELRRFGAAHGAEQETLMGLSGLGDLVLTCSSAQSRNFALGVALGQGQSFGQASAGKLAEGAYTANVLVDMAKDNDIDMPIASAVAGILNGRLDVDDAIAELMTRPQRQEG